MSESTWYNIVTGMHEALYKGYMSKSSRQRNKREVKEAWNDRNNYAMTLQDELKNESYEIGEYRHFNLRDRKKMRQISVLPFRDRCVQNDVKNAIEPLLMRCMTDEMMGGLPQRGVLSSVKKWGVIYRMKRILNDMTLTHYIQGDISKFYDNIDNVIAMRIIESKIKDKRTLAVIRQHLFKQKRLAIGDPFSHLISNIVMSEIIRAVKRKFKGLYLIDFADDVFIAGHSKEKLILVRKEMKRLAKKYRLHYKRIYIKPIDGERKDGIVFCGYKYFRKHTKLTKAMKQNYVKSRHRKRSMGSYNGFLKVADTKNLRYLIEYKDNRHMSDKIRRPFAGRPFKIETLQGIKHTIVDFKVKPSRQRDCEQYYHIQAIAEGLGLIVYSTGSSKICEFLKTKTAKDLPLRDMKIVNDWSGYYYEGTVYTDAEEEELIRKQFNL